MEIIHLNQNITIIKVGNAAHNKAVTRMLFVDILFIRKKQMLE